MKLVVDANILFSSIIKNGITRRILLFSEFYLFAPDMLLIEFYKHNENLLTKSKCSNEELLNLMNAFMEIITIIPKKHLECFIDEATNISPDVNDLMYFAAALKLNCPIWSNDKRLKNQRQIRVLNTQEILEMLK